MRFILKFNNGTWKTFDTHRFDDVCPHDTQKSGLAHVAKLNSRA